MKVLASESRLKNAFIIVKAIIYFQKLSLYIMNKFTLKTKSLTLNWYLPSFECKFIVSSAEGSLNNLVFMVVK